MAIEKVERKPFVKRYALRPPYKDRGVGLVRKEREYHKGEPCPYKEGVLCQEGYCDNCAIREVELERTPGAVAVSGYTGQYQGRVKALPEGNKKGGDNR